MTEMISLNFNGAPVNLEIAPKKNTDHIKNMVPVAAFRIESVDIITKKILEYKLENIYVSCSSASIDLGVNVGLVYMCCNSQNNVQTCRSKVNQGLYRFEYTSLKPTIYVTGLKTSKSAAAAASSTGSVVTLPSKVRGRPKSSVQHRLREFTIEELAIEVERRVLAAQSSPIKETDIDESEED